jgi:hypothetical protein
MGLVDPSTIYNAGKGVGNALGVPADLIKKGFTGMMSLTPAGPLFKMWKGFTDDAKEKDVNESTEDKGIFESLGNTLRDTVSGAKSAYQARRAEGGGFFESLGAGAGGAVKGAKGINVENEKMMMEQAKAAGITDPKELSNFWWFQSNEGR